ncbi:MAG: nuclear pore complex subunit [Flavobacteriales bacterium]|nr:MAG: nuclear pore complex subunit [Flavobacteriales bacterium]
MKNYNIEATENTPKLELNSDNNTLLFEGESRPEDVQKFYQPVLSWLEDYSKHLYFIKDQNDTLIEVNCNFKFEYFNSSSAKYVMDIINFLKKLKSSTQLNINWHYEEMDEDMLEAGEEFEKMLDVSFNFIKE